MAGEEDAIGKEVKVFWEDENEWFEGIIENYHPKRGYHIQYFDGEDEWLKNLDHNVEFINCDPPLDKITNSTNYETEMRYDESDGDKIDETFANNNKEDNDDDRNSDSSVNSSNEDVVVEGNEHVSYNEDRHPRPFKDEKHELLKLKEDDIKFDYNKKINNDDSDGINISDVVASKGFEEELDHHDASEVPEGVLVLSGQVFGALNLPVTSVDERDGRVFFRVLYVEGGSTSIMFRCKTTIYKSEFASDLCDPIWEDAIFRFEMVLTDGQDERDIQGEILIVVYRNRAAGGSDFVGQVSYQLPDMIRSGTTGEQGDGVVSRTVSGEQPLVARLGDVAGGRATLEADLSLSWRPSTPMPPTSASRRPDKGGSIAPSSRGAGSVMGSRSKVSGRPKSAGAAAVSGKSHSGVRRQKEQARIERENAIIAKKLGNVAFYAPGVATGPGKQVSKATKEKNQTNEVGSSRPKGPSTPAQSIVSKRTAGAGASAVEGKETYALFDKLLDTFNQLKEQAGAEEKEVISLRARLSRTRTQISKYEFALGRLRAKHAPSKLEAKHHGASAATSADSEKLPGPSSVGLRVRNPSMGLETKGSGMTAAPRAYITLEAPKNDKALAADGKDEGQPDSGQEKEELPGGDYADPELRDMVQEHEALQDVRRSYVARIQRARQRHQAAVEYANKIESTFQNVRRKIDPAMNQKAKGGKAEEKGGGGGGGGKNEQRQVEADADAAILEYRALKSQLDILRAKLENNFHVSALIDEIEESRCVLKEYSRWLGDGARALDTATFERDMWKERLQLLLDDKLATRLHSSIVLLRSALSRMRRRETLTRLSAAEGDIELQLQRMLLADSNSNSKKK